MKQVQVDDELQAKIDYFDKIRPQPLSLQQILEASTQKHEKHNRFLKEEFSVRCAERICMMQERLPPVFHEIPELQLAYQKHLVAFQEMISANDVSQEEFLPVVRRIVERGRDIVPLMCKGMSRLVHDKDISIDETATNTFLNEFLLNRIGSNVLMSQYLATRTGDFPTSVVDPNCNVAAICRETARHVQSLCFQETKYRPVIQVVESHDRDGPCKKGLGCIENFAFIPGALSYIVQELLKNSAIATAKNRHKTPHDKRVADKTISVVVCADEQRVMIHIGDRALGIPFHVGQHIWSYLYTTNRGSGTKAEEEEDSTGDLEKSGATDLGGFGVGLPLSKLYASYLGGSINLVSLPGYGTHAYVFFPRLPEKLVETVPIREEGWSTARYNEVFIL